MKPLMKRNSNLNGNITCNHNPTTAPARGHDEKMMTIKPDRYYLRTKRLVADSWDIYHPGELIRNARDQARSFIKLDRAILAAREYGWPDDALEIRRGDTL